MATIKQRCKLCMSSIQEDEFTDLDDDILKRLDFLHIDLHLNDEERNFLCSQCDDDSENIFDFKSCILINTESNAINNEDISSQNSFELADESLRCHLCKSYEDPECMISLTKLLENGTIMEVFHGHLPELDLKDANKSMVCEVCQKCLAVFWNLVETWLKATNRSDDDMTDDESVSKRVALKTENYENDDFSESDINSTGSCVLSDDNREIKNNNRKQRIKICNGSGSDSDDSENVENDELLDCTGSVSIENIENDDTDENGKCQELPLKAEEIEIKDVDILLEDYVNNRFFHEDKKHYLRQHLQEVPIYKRDKCPYKSNIKYNLKIHLINHKNLDEVLVNKCKKYSYKNRSKGNLKKHKSLDEVQTFKCKECSFETMHKTNLYRHLLIHKSLDEVQMFKCKKCSYETKSKGNLKRHLLIHKTLDEVQKYKCKQCSYEAKYKSSLKRHLLIHKCLDEVHKYKCKECSYVAKRKSNLTRHLLIHKSLDEVQTYNCKDCSYETKHKMALKIHLIKHKNLEDVQLYKCKECSFETKHKGNLTRHFLKHKKLDEVQIFKCKECSFKTKHRVSLKKHLLVHKNLDEV